MFSRRRARSQAGSKFSDEGKSSGNEYPLQRGNNHDSDDSSDGDGPPGRPSRPSLPPTFDERPDSSDKNRPVMKLKRNKSQHISHGGTGGGGVQLHGIWLGAFLADCDMIKEILKDQPEMINERSRRADNKTPLMLACQAGDPECVQLLLDNGAESELDGADVFGRTALMLAAKYDFPEIIDILLKYDNRLARSVSEQNMDALMYAVDSGATAAVSRLMQCSPDLEIMATGGEHFMRTVKNIAEARIEETQDRKYNSIMKLLNGESIQIAPRTFAHRTEKQKRRISGNGAVLLMESFSQSAGGANRK